MPDAPDARNHSAATALARALARTLGGVNSLAGQCHTLHSPLQSNCNRIAMASQSHRRAIAEPLPNYCGAIAVARKNPGDFGFPALPGYNSARFPFAAGLGIVLVFTHRAGIGRHRRGFARGILGATRCAEPGFIFSIGSGCSGY